MHPLPLDDGAVRYRVSVSGPTNPPPHWNGRISPERWPLPLAREGIAFNQLVIVCVASGRGQRCGTLFQRALLATQLVGHETEAHEQHHPGIGFRDRRDMQRAAVD